MTSDTFLSSMLDSRPYYTDSHLKWRERCSTFVEQEILPYVDEWEEAKEVSPELWKKAYNAGLLPAVVGAASQGFDFVDAKAPEGFDCFHEFIFLDEVSRCGSGGIVWALMGCILWSLPPVIGSAQPWLRERVAREVLMGEKRMSLAVTEPMAGSDVASMKATAKADTDGSYIITGQKKWITGGIWADYFVVGARTGKAGMGGITMFLVEKSFGNIACTRMNVMGMGPSGTTFVEFQDVKVPSSHVLGKENEGFKAIMHNFNHERWAFAVMSHRFTRVLLAESVNYAQRRSTFGKKLVEHPVIRLKLAEMARQAEALGHWLDNVTFQMSRDKECDLAAPIALMKVQASKAMEFAAREASQIFGGNAYTRTGLGRVVERLYRDVRAHAIPGGSEEIMLDLGVRQALKTSGFAKL